MKTTKNNTPFTPREIEIMKLMAHGQNSRAIGRSLGISIETVRTHRRNILNKTSKRTTVELIYHAAKTRLI